MIDIQKFIELINSCPKIKTKKFKKGELISTYITNRSQLGILIDGSADLIKYDLEGNRSIIERFNQGDVYGEIFHVKESINGLFIEAVTNVVIAQFEYQDITNKCKESCLVHELINSQLNQIILDRIRIQNTRIEFLTKRSTREKLLAYFTYASKGRINKSFRIPFSYTDLADYLNVDRSAMTREISDLVDEGFIEKDGRNITMLY